MVIRLTWIEAGAHRTHVLLVLALNVAANDDRAAQWRAGAARAILSLAQCHSRYGTYLGAIVINTSFARLYARNETVYIEVTKGCQTAAHASLTIQAFLSRGTELADAMPWDFFSHPSSLADLQDVNEPAMRVLMDHLARARTIVAGLDADALPGALS
jgi:hypothetical protein